MFDLAFGSAFAGALTGELEAAPALSPLLVWSTVWVWLGIALAQALIVTISARRPRRAALLRAPRTLGTAGCRFRLAPCCPPGNSGR